MERSIELTTYWPSRRDRRLCDRKKKNVRKGRQKKGGKRVRTRHWLWIAAARFSSLVSRIRKAGRSVDSDDKEPVLLISGPGR